MNFNKRVFKYSALVVILRFSLNQRKATSLTLFLTLRMINDKPAYVNTLYTSTHTYIHFYNYNSMQSPFSFATHTTATQEESFLWVIES